MNRTDLKTQLAPFIRIYDFPTDVLVETIARCNLRCIMCPQAKLTRPAGVMSIDLWKKIVDEIAAKSPSTALWPALMGEPFLDEQIFARLEYAKKSGIERVNLNTNLLRFEKDKIEELFDCGLDAMFVGVDGATSETYGKIRFPGRLDVLLDKLFFILNERDRRNLTHPQVSVQFIVMEENEHEEQAFIDFWKNSGVDVDIKIRPRLNWSAGVQTWSKMRGSGRQDRIPCTWLLRQMAIHWNGRVPQCDADWNGATYCGDINKMSIEDVWKKGIRRLQQEHLAGRFDSSGLCPGCNEWMAGLSEKIAAAPKEPQA